MLKRFVAMVMALVMLLDVSVVVYAAVPYPSCGHTKFTIKESYRYTMINSLRHRVELTKTITCDVCKQSTSGCEISEEYHNDTGRSDYHVDVLDKHVFRKTCSKCGHIAEEATKLCSGPPHVTSPW